MVVSVVGKKTVRQALGLQLGHDIPHGSLSVEKTKKSTKSKINAEIKQEDEEHWWSTEEKRRIGSICKTMMDVGRAFMFRDKGFAADIISYIDEETSMENRLLRVRAKKAMPNK